MECVVCKTDADLDTRVCHSCGVQLVNEDDIKSYDEISIEWVKDAFVSWNWEIIDNERKDSYFSIEKDGFVVAVLNFLNMRTLMFSIQIPIKDKFKKNIPEILQKVNTVNLTYPYAVFKVGEDEEGSNILVTSTLFICEKISSKDILGFVELFVSNTTAAIDEENLYKYAKYINVN